jgi:hypothetical protein
MTHTHKRQHTIPRSYLSSWLEPYTPPGQTGAIHLINKADRSIRRKSPEKTFTETDRYTVHMKDGSRDLTVEKRLSTIESDFQGVLQAVRANHILARSHRVKLATFTAAMLGRSKPQADHLHGQFKGFQNHLADMEYSMAAPPTSSQELSRYLEDYPAKLVIQMIETAAPVLLSMSLTILTTDDPVGFITSDSPATMFNPEGYKFPPQYQSPGLMQTDVEVRLPLTPRHLALYTHNRDAKVYQPLSSKMTDEVNRTAWYFAHDTVVSKTGELKPFWFSDRSRPDDAWNPDVQSQEELSDTDMVARIVKQFEHAKGFHDAWRKRVYLPGTVPE